MFCVARCPIGVYVDDCNVEACTSLLGLLANLHTGHWVKLSTLIILSHRAILCCLPVGAEVMLHETPLDKQIQLSDISQGPKVCAFRFVFAFGSPDLELEHGDKLDKQFRCLDGGLAPNCGGLGPHTSHRTSQCNNHLFTIAG